MKFIQRAVKSLREGDTGDKWNRRLVGRSEDRGSKQERESVTLESRTVGRSVGQRIGELEKYQLKNNGGPLCRRNVGGQNEGGN